MRLKCIAIAAVFLGALAGAVGAPLTANATPLSAAGAVVASSNPPAPSPHMHAHNPSDYSQPAQRLPSALVGALNRDLGKTGAEYLADAAAAADAVKVVSGLKARGVHVLGSSMDDSTLVVNVVNSTDAAAVTAAGGQAQLGAPTPVDLAGLTFAPAQDIHGGQGITWSVTGGGGYRCSTGFNGYALSTGAFQLATAGHCVAAMSTISGAVQFANQTVPGNAFTTGPSIGLPVSGSGSFGSGYDAGLVAEATTGNTAQPDVLTWGGGAGGPLASAALAVTGESAAIVGADLCKSGSTSGWTCGTVKSVDTTLNVLDDSGVTHQVNSILASTCVQSGDSGGSALTGQLAVGITSSSVSSPACGQANYFSAFFPMISASAGASVTSQLGSQWEPMVSVSVPVVTASSGGDTVTAGTMSGTLANPDPTSKVSLYLDGSTTAAVTVSASSGSWTATLPVLALGTHNYSAVASWETRSHSTAAAGSLTTKSALPAPALVVSGNKLVDSRTNTTFIPHGVNWPSFEYACEQGWGYSGTNSAAEAQAIASWKVNIVRLPLNEDCWLGTNGSPGYGTASGYRAAVQAWVTNLHNAGLAVILDLHWTAPNGYPADGQRAMADSQSVTFWNSVATSYSSDPSVTFDLFNEPYSRGSFQLSWSCWANGGCQAPIENDTSPLSGATFTVVGMNQLVSTVRAAGAAQPILLGGLNYSNDLTGWLANRPTDTQLVASWHDYAGQGCDTTTCWNTQIVPVAATVPVMITEFGEDDGGSSYFSSVMTWADSHGIGYAPWAWWDVSSSESVSSSYYALYSGSSFTPKAPSGTTYHDHLVPPPAFTPPTGPLGSFDATTLVAGGLRLTGWSIDPAQPGESYVWVNVDGNGAAYPVNTPLSWFPGLYPQYGQNHGFDVTLNLTTGTHQICVYGTKALLGCKSVYYDRGQGNFDTAFTTPGAVQVSGWSLDLSTTASGYVWVNVDGSGGAYLAAASLPWLNSYFAGIGANHGFNMSIKASPGAHQVCVYGTDSLLGCRQVTVPPTSYGSFDTATTSPGSVRLQGWSVDLSVAPASSYIWVNVDGTGGPYLAAGTLSWFEGLFPGAGTSHGFDVTLKAGPGTHQVCIYGSAGLLSCKQVTIPATDYGSFDSATPTVGGVRIQGWSVDLSVAPASSYIWVNVDGTGGPYLAAGTLSWFEGLFPGAGTAHGFDVTVPIPAGSHKVCVYGSSQLLGCKTVSPG